MSCSETELEEFSPLKILTRCHKRQSFIREGLPVTSIYFIYSGKVKVTKTGLDGREQIVRLARPGDIIGHRGYGPGKTYPITATVIEDSDLCSFSNEDFFRALKTVPALALNLLMFYAEELNNTENRLRSLAQMPVRERVIEAIFLIKNKFGEVQGHINGWLSRREIGDLAGTTEEQVIRVLSELRKAGIIETRGRRIRLMKEGQLSSMLPGPY